MSTVEYVGDFCFLVRIPGEVVDRVVRDIHLYAYRCDHCRGGPMAHDPTLPIPPTPRGTGVHNCSHEAAVAAYCDTQHTLMLRETYKW